jgi:hypothetical protein
LLSGRHFIAEGLNATSASAPIGAFAFAIAIGLAGHDNDQFDPVEAPQ